MKLHARTWDRLVLPGGGQGPSADEILSAPWVLAGVASVREIGSSAEIQLGPYAGNLHVGPNFSIQVSELVPGTVATCLRLSRSGRRQAVHQGAGVNRIEATLAVADEFVAVCGGLFESGPVKEYVSREAAVTWPRGAIKVAATVRGPWARGRRSVAVCRWRELTEDTELNRLLLSAAVRAERIIRTGRGASLHARALVVALSGAQFVANPNTAPVQVQPDLIDVIGLARGLIEGVPWSQSTSAEREPISSWVNVERVFEEAVLEISRTERPDADVSHGKDSGVPIFHAEASEPPALRKIAEPDVVVQLGSERLILDAKYRRSGEYPGEAELYQLIAHAVAHKATRAALVTPALAGGPTRRRLGRIATGCTIDVVAVDPSNEVSMRSGVGDWLRDSVASQLSSDPDVRKLNPA